MSPKYSTGDDTGARQWDADRQYVLHQWTSRPFSGHRHRHERVEQRIVIDYIHDVGADIRYEARSDDTPKLPDEWRAVETIEVRSYGAFHRRHERARWVR